MPFKSQAQWKFAFANKMPWAKKWAHQTTGTSKAGTKRGKRAFGRLPARKRPVKASKGANRTGGRKNAVRASRGRKN